MCTSNLRKTEIIRILTNYLIQLKREDLIDRLYQLDQDILDFLLNSINEKKGIVFVYHHSNYEQKYRFTVKPYIVISIKLFLEIQDLFIFDVEYKVVPLLLTKGNVYENLRSSTHLDIKDTLIQNEDDVKTLVEKCRKDNLVNLWVLHQRNHSDLISMLKNYIPDEDQIINVNDKITYEEEKNYHIVLLLMSEGMHYHSFMKYVPKGVSISKILPLENNIRLWIESKI